MSHGKYQVIFIAGSQKQMSRGKYHAIFIADNPKQMLPNNYLTFAGS